MQTYSELIISEAARLQRASTRELSSIAAALSLHSWGNTLEEKARLDAAKRLIDERLRAKRRA